MSDERVPEFVRPISRDSPLISELDETDNYLMDLRGKQFLARNSFFNEENVQIEIQTEDGIILIKMSEKDWFYLFNKMRKDRQRLKHKIRRRENNGEKE